MGMLEKLKSLLGLGQERERRQAGRHSANVTVDREPATGSEDAVKGTQTGTGQGAIGSGSGSATSSAGATAADAQSTEQQSGGSPSGGASGAGVQTGSDATTDSSAPGAGESEPGSAVDGPEREDGNEEDTVGEDAAAATDAQETEAESEEEGDDGAAQPSADGDLGTDEDVTVLDGIGSAYSERLEAVDVETVADLADADAAAVAEETDLGENRVAGWIEQARER